MKGKNWREYEPPKRRRRRRRKGGLLRKLCFVLMLFLVGYVGFLVYYNFGKPYTVALDAGHGGADVGAEGVIQEVALTEQTVAALQTLLEEDGRFRVVLSRKAGEGATVTERNHKFRRRHPDVMLSVHGNASDSSSANGFECYPSPPGCENHEESLAFAACLAQEMQNKVRDTVQTMTGLKVKEVNIYVQGISFDHLETVEDSAENKETEV